MAFPSFFQTLVWISSYFRSFSSIFLKPGVSGEIRITLVMIKTAGIRQGVTDRPQRVGYTSAWKKRLIVSALEQFTALLGSFLSPDLTRPWWMGLESRAERLSLSSRRGLRPSVSDMTRSLWTVFELEHDLRLIFLGLHQVTFAFYTAFPKLRSQFALIAPIKAFKMTS